MPALTKKETRLKLEFVANSDHTIHAGLVVIEAMARRFGLWDKLRAHACLDARKDKKRGYPRRRGNNTVKPTTPS